MATSKILNGHSNGDLLSNLNKNNKFNGTKLVECDEKLNNKNGLNGDSYNYSDEEEIRKYEEEYERIKKLTR